MTAETIRELLEPLTGRSGSIFIIVSRIGPSGLATGENKRRTGIQIRPDGLIRLERETGWAVIDPAEVVGVVWDGGTGASPGQFLYANTHRGRKPRPVQASAVAVHLELYPPGPPAPGCPRVPGLGSRARPHPGLPRHPPPGSLGRAGHHPAAPDRPAAPLSRLLHLTAGDLVRDPEGQTWLRLGDPPSPVPPPAATTTSPPTTPAAGCSPAATPARPPATAACSPSSVTLACRCVPPDLRPAPARPGCPRSRHRRRPRLPRHHHDPPAHQRRRHLEPVRRKP